MIRDYDEIKVADIISRHMERKFSANTTYEVEKQGTGGYLIKIKMKDQKAIFDDPAFDTFIEWVRERFVHLHENLRVQYLSIES